KPPPVAHTPPQGALRELLPGAAREALHEPRPDDRGGTDPRAPGPHRAAGAVVPQPPPPRGTPDPPRSPLRGLPLDEVGAPRPGAARRPHRQDGAGHRLQRRLLQLRARPP